MKNYIISILLALATGICAKSDFKVYLMNRNAPQKSVTHELQQFEEQFTYPFSHTEEFTIKHGMDGDYLAFFKSLGKPYYYIARTKKGGEIAAAVCCVLRNMVTCKGKTKKAWYIGDLKVDQNYQGQHLPTFLIKKIAFWRYLQCSRGFAICMNPMTGEPKAASIFKKHNPWHIDTHVLNFYTLSADQMGRHKDALKKILVDHGYMQKHHELLFVSTDGVKDYEITDTISQHKRPWRLLHIQAGEGMQACLENDATYMICAVEGTALDNDFKTLLDAPSSTAQILSYGMKNFDFNYLTSNQI